MFRSKPPAKRAPRSLKNDTKMKKNKSVTIMPDADISQKVKDDVELYEFIMMTLVLDNREVKPSFYWDRIQLIR